MRRPAIDMAYARDVLFELLSMPSPTGYTDQIVHRVCDRLTTLGLGFEITRRGAIRVEIEGRPPNPARAIVAHLDPLGAARTTVLLGKQVSVRLGLVWRGVAIK